MEKIQHNWYSFKLDSLITQGKKASSKLLTKLFHKKSQNAVTSEPTNLKGAKVEKIAKTENDIEISVSKEALDVELERMDAMLANPNCEHSQILEQAYLILMMLYHKNEELERKFADEKEPILFNLVSQLKGTYNTWSTLASVAIPCGMEFSGGLMRMGSFVPGSAAKLNDIGKLLSGIGHGTTGLSQIPANKSEAKRQVIEYLRREAERNRSQRDEGFRQEREKGHGAQSSMRNIAEIAYKCARTTIGAAN